MTQELSVEPIEILLVEDNPGDVRLLMEGFKEGRLNNQIHVVPDGVQALAFLHRKTPYALAPRPDLILLDLNLPRLDGREVLARCKMDADLRRIPIVILTSSRADKDVFECYDLGANSYVSKPPNLEKFLAVIQSIEDFWLTVVQLPSH